jgi:hypothetical protein
MTKKNDGLAEENKDSLPKITYDAGGAGGGGGTPPTSNSLAEEFDPLDPPVVERDHVKANMGIGNSGKPAEVIPEDTIKVNPLGNEPKKEEPKKSSSSASSSSSSSSEKTEKPFENPELKDMSKGQKRREAEKLANTLIFHYCLYVPMPFKSWASFNERRVEQLAIEDKIDLNQVFDIGKEITAKEYMEGVNAEVERAFSVSDERKNEIREPLIEVLIEQGMVLTAQQRLLLAVGSHVVEMGMTAFKISQMNSKILEHMVQKHAEKKEASKPSPPPASAPSPHSSPTPSSGGGGSHHRDNYGNSRTVYTEENSTDQSHSEEHHADDSVTATDESTGENVGATVLSSKIPDERKSGGRPKGTGTRQSKNAISVDEAIDDDKVSLKDEIIEGKGQNGDAEGD